MAPKNSSIFYWGREHIPPAPSFAILGKTRSGKSYFVKDLAKNYAKNYKVIVVDTKNEFSKDFPTLSIRDFGHRSFLARCNAIGKTKKIHDVAEILAGACLLYDRTILWIEEIGEVVPKIGQLYETCPNIAKLLLQGHARRQYVIAVSQMPQDMHLSFIRQADNAYLFETKPIEHDMLLEKFRVDIEWDKIPVEKTITTEDKQRLELKPFYSVSEGHWYHTLGSKRKVGTKKQSPGPGVMEGVPVANLGQKVEKGPVVESEFVEEGELK